MADKKIVSKYKYKMELSYTDTTTNKTQSIKSECIKSLTIDHNYIDNVMPILYMNINLERKLADHMILNADDNFLTLVIYKYDEMADYRLDVEYIRGKFTYFLPEDLNKNDSIDYNAENEDQHNGDLYRNVALGLLLEDHINNNKQSINVNMKNTTMFNIVKHVLSHMKNVVIEPFNYNEKVKQLVVPARDSINKTLKYLNNHRVFYKTKYRFYQDFDYVYLISSSGKAVSNGKSKYKSVLIDIKDEIDDESNDPGIIKNTTKKNHNLIVSYLNTEVYDNVIRRKSKNGLRIITTSGASKKELKKKSSKSTSKVSSVRINNGNTYMAKNIESYLNSSNIFITINKTDLDTSVFSINKKYSISNIDKYKSNDGDYLLIRKRDAFVRTDDEFNINTTLNFIKYDE